MKFNSLFFLLQKPEIYKFVIVGICNGIIVLFLTDILTDFLNIFYLFSVLVAYEISIISSFFMNDNWTFNKIKKKPGFFRTAPGDATRAARARAHSGTRPRDRHCPTNRGAGLLSHRGTAR